MRLRCSTDESRPSSVSAITLTRPSLGSRVRATSPRCSSRAISRVAVGRWILLARGELARRQRAVAIERRERGDLGRGEVEPGLLAQPPRGPRNRNPKLGGDRR